MNELDFTMEMNAEGVGNLVEDELFALVDGELRRLADGHNDLTGAAATLRGQAKGDEGIFLYEATIVAYIRPNNLAASAKDESPQLAMSDALSAVVRQIREQREKLQKHWEQPGNDPVTQEMLEIEAAEQFSAATQPIIEDTDA